MKKPKDFWRTLKSMGLWSKAASASNNCLKDKNEIVFDNTKNYSIFKSFFSNLVQSLVSKLPLSSMSLLNLKSHPTMIILSLRMKILNFLPFFVFTKYLTASFLFSMLNDKKDNLLLCRLSSDLGWIRCNLTVSS